MGGNGISCTICISAPRPRQLTIPAPHHSVFYRPDSIPAALPTASEHWRHKLRKKTGGDLAYPDSPEWETLKCETTTILQRHASPPSFALTSPFKWGFCWSKAIRKCYDGKSWNNVWDDPWMVRSQPRPIVENTVPHPISINEGKGFTAHSLHWRTTLCTWPLWPGASFLWPCKPNVDPLYMQDWRATGFGSASLTRENLGSRCCPLVCWLCWRLLLLALLSLLSWPGAVLAHRPLG